MKHFWRNVTILATVGSFATGFAAWYRKNMDTDSSHEPRAKHTPQRRMHAAAMHRPAHA